MCLAVPGEIVAILGGESLSRQAKVNFGGVIKVISLAFLPEARMGDFVLVHAGVAISVVDAEEAERTLDYLREIEDLDPVTEDSP